MARAAPTASAVPVLQVEGISVAYSGRTILDDVAFEIRAGEFTGLIGSNGLPTTAWNGNPSAAPSGTAVVTLASILPPSSAADETQYNYYDSGSGRLAYTVNSAGDVIYNQYDAAGNLVATTQYALPVSVASLAAGATPASLVTPSANDRTQYTLYDLGGRVIASINAAG